MYGGNSARKPAGSYVDLRTFKHIVSSSEVVSRVDMAVDMMIMLKMRLSSDDSSHHLLHPKELVAWSEGFTYQPRSPVGLVPTLKLVPQGIFTPYSILLSRGPLPLGLSPAGLPLVVVYGWGGGDEPFYDIHMLAQEDTAES